MDRDLNAAINLAKLANSSTDSLTSCGRGGAEGGLVLAVKQPSVKQEPDASHGLSISG
jgi:hypothetical protein